MNIKYYYYFDWGRRYNQVRFLAIQEGKRQMGTAIGKETEVNRQERRGRRRRGRKRRRGRGKRRGEEEVEGEGKGE
jgi:hypothetical protein